MARLHERTVSARDRAALEKVHDQIEKDGPATVLVNADGIQKRADFAGCDDVTRQEFMDVRRLPCLPGLRV